MNELHLFAGAGGGILGGELLGHRCVCAVEIEEYPRRVLLQRQREGILPLFPIWDDINTFKGDEWEGVIDLIAGGFPCQDISASGKGKGLEGERSSLWWEMHRVICEIRPKFVFMENSPIITSRGLGRVLGDLAEIGYNARWMRIGIRDIGGACERNRWFCLAYNASTIKERWEYATNELQNKAFEEFKIWSKDKFFTLLDDDKIQYEINSEDCRMGDGIPDFMDRFSAIGNAQSPAVAATAFSILSEGLI